MASYTLFLGPMSLQVVYRFYAKELNVSGSQPVRFESRMNACKVEGAGMSLEASEHEPRL